MTQHLNLLVKRNSVARQGARQILPPLALALLLPLAMWLLGNGTETRLRDNEAQLRQQLAQTRAQFNERMQGANAGPDQEI